ncbi:MAG TPA: cytochrome b/b6 domain-containing protein [Steroidobacteraceae bacterium]|jgi:cytochrome b|nr:cytochrome b/b6 domain-containing protein [Steroidobacteraceae bacterium]
MNDDAAPSPARVRVWDVPTRLTHWLLVAGFALSWWTGDSGRLEWHRWSGYGLLGLVLFRIYWGFFGSSTARFASFVRGPRTVVAYLRGAWRAAPGHNPLGALSVLALLTLLAAQILLGLFAVDVDGIESGPLSLYVSFETGRAAAEWHDAVFDALLWLVALHILAIAYYRIVKQQRLVAAMFHGRRVLPAAAPAVQRASALRLLVGIILAALLTWLVSSAFQPF